MYCFSDIIFLLPRVLWSIVAIAELKRMFLAASTGSISIWRFDNGWEVSESHLSWLAVESNSLIEDLRMASRTKLWILIAAVCLSSSEGSVVDVWGSFGVSSPGVSEDESFELSSTSLSADEVVSSIWLSGLTLSGQDDRFFSIGCSCLFSTSLSLRCVFCNLVAFLHNSSMEATRCAVCSRWTAFNKVALARRVATFVCPQ